MYLSILDASRKPVFVQDGLRLQAPMHPVDIGGDLTIPLQTAAIAMLPGMRGHEAETVPLLATLVTRPALRQAALAAIRRMPVDAWPRAQLEPVAGEVLRYLAAIPPVQRTGPGVAEAFALGRDLIAGIADPQRRSKLEAELAALLVRVIRIEAVAAQMKFDVVAVHGDRRRDGGDRAREQGRDAAQPGRRQGGRPRGRRPGRRQDGGAAGRVREELRAVDAGGAVLDPAAQSRRDRAGALHRAHAARQLSVHLHVPRPIGAR